MDYIKEAEDILKLLNSYLIYFIPGFISIWEYSFLKGKCIRENINSIIKAVIISYLYVNIFCYNWLVIAMSIILPYLLYWILTLQGFNEILKSLKINTSLSDNILDLIQSKEKDEKAIALKLFMDEKGIMYEGQLRVHESDNQKEQVIALSGYRRYIRNASGKYDIKNDYADDKSRWVIVKYNDVDRIEVKYQNDK